MATVSDSRFDDFIRELYRRLEPEGFEKTGRKLRRRRGSEWLFVDFQRDRHSDAEHTTVWGWVGLTSETIARFRGERRITRRPAAWEISCTLGTFMPEVRGEPEWLFEQTPDPDWSAGQSFQRRGSAAEVAEHLAATIVERVLPAVEPFASDEEICRLVLGGQNLCGRNTVDQFAMAILTARFGPREAFERYAAATLERSDLVRSHYEPLIDRLRKGELYAPGFEPATPPER